MYYVNAKARKLLYRAQFVSYKQFLHSVEWLQRSASKKKKKEKRKRNPLNSLHRRAAKLILSDLSIPTDDKLKTRKLLPLTNN